MKFIRVIQAIESLGVSIIGTETEWIMILRVNFVSCNFFYSFNRRYIYLFIYLG